MTSTTWATTTSRAGTMTRRGLLAAGAAAGAALAIAPGAPASAAADTTTHSLADAVIAAFRRHPLVAIGEIHGQQAHHDALLTLLLDPRLPDAVDDIVVEFGNALYQPLIDRFTAGAPIEDRDLRPIWRNTTQSPVATLDAPMYEQFFRTVRAANWPLPTDRKIRVLLGDPPIDWSRVQTSDDVLPFDDRDGHAVSVLEREVLSRGRRALVCYGSNHVMHGGGGAVAQIERRTGTRAYVILAGGHPRLAALPRRAVVPTQGTWLGTADSAEFSYLPGMCGLPLGAIADAVLYLGQIEDQTASLWNPAVYLDPVYWAELQRRNTILGNPVDLDQQYRQDQSVRWPTTPADDC